MFTIRTPRRLLSEARATSLAMPQAWLVDELNGGTTLAGETVSVKGSLAIADVFSAVNIITGDVSLCPLKTYRNLDASASNAGKGIEEAPDHRAYTMLHDSPFPGVPAHRFWAIVGGHELLWGNFFLEKLRDPATDLVAALRPLEPSTVEIEYNWVTGAKRFWVTRLTGERTGPHSDSEILHGFSVSTDGIVGLSPIQQARESLGAAKARTRWEGEAYGQHPYAAAVMMHPNKVSDPKRIRESWRAIYGKGSKDRGGLAVFEEGATLGTMKMPMADMQFVETAQLSKTEIATIFKLPPSYLGGSTGDSLTYSTVEQNRIQKATQAVAPLCNNIAQFLSHDVSIFPFRSWFCEFVLEGLMRGEPKARADYWATMKDVVGLKPAYIAGKENIPPDALEAPKPVPAPLQLAPPSVDNGIIAPVSNG